jgi:biotin-(acetyl-CoA carboxylase) ligase
VPGAGEGLPTIAISREAGSRLPAEALLDAAYEGAPAGACTALVEGGAASEGEKDPLPEAGRLRVSVLARPQVPMGHLVAVAPVAALGAADALEALGADPGAFGIGWPHDLVLADGEGSVCRVSTKAGYADGTFVVLSLDLGLRALADLLGRGAAGGDAGGLEAPVEAEAVVRALRDAVCARLDAWAAAVAGEGARVAPWASFLPEYFDRVALMGRPVDVRYPNGSVYARGYFVGVDIWGRATVRTRRAGDIEFPAERFGIFPQSGQD